MAFSPLKTASWNIAAVNNNPWEYWLTHSDADYKQLMVDVERFIEAPGERDVPVNSVFTQQMYAELETAMDAVGWDGKEGCAATWAGLGERTIIGGFLKDKDIGSKRFISFPDRFLNTIELADGGCASRPTPVTGFEGDMATIDKWWACWKGFVFEEALELPGKKGEPPASTVPYQLLSKIPRNKYPALSEAEEALSLRLQVPRRAARPEPSP